MCDHPVHTHKGCTCGPVQHERSRPSSAIRGATSVVGCVRGFIAPPPGAARAPPLADTAPLPPPVTAGCRSNRDIPPSSKPHSCRYRQRVPEISTIPPFPPLPLSYPRLQDVIQPPCPDRRAAAASKRRRGPREKDHVDGRVWGSARGARGKGGKGGGLWSPVVANIYLVRRQLPCTMRRLGAMKACQ